MLLTIVLYHHSSRTGTSGMEQDPPAGGKIQSARYISLFSFLFIQRTPTTARTSPMQRYDEGGRVRQWRWEGATAGAAWCESWGGTMRPSTYFYFFCFLFTNYCMIAPE